jgi:phosphopantothenoylcysteine synthetase/decarboxylase
MKRKSTSSLPTPKVRKQAPVDDHKVKFSTIAENTKTASPASSEPKSILKKPLRPEIRTASSDSKPKMTMSASALLKANTKAASKTQLLPHKGRPQPVPIAATRGDVTGGMGRKRRARREDKEEEVNSGDDSDSDNDGEDENESGDDAEESDEDDFEGMPATPAKSKDSTSKTLSGCIN